MGSKLFQRSCELILGKRKLTNPPFTIEFEAEFAVSGKANIATVRMYNPSKATIAETKKNTQVLVSAGYDDDLGQFIIGTVFSFTIEPKKPDVILELKVTDGTGAWVSGFISKTYGPGALASTIIPDVLNIVGLKAGSITLGHDFEYENGLAVNEPIHSILRRLARDTESEFFFRSGRILFQEKDLPDLATLVKLSAKTGLINAPKKTDKGWKFESLINYRLGAGTVVYVESPTATGTFQIFKGKHSFLANETLTSFEAAPYKI